MQSKKPFWQRPITIWDRIFVATMWIVVTSMHASPLSDAEANGTWRLPPADCYPNFDDFDYRYTIQDGPDAIVWWCDNEDGLQTHWRTGNYGDAAQSRILVMIKAARDLWALDQATFHRP